MRLGGMQVLLRKRDHRSGDNDDVLPLFSIRHHAGKHRLLHHCRTAETLPAGSTQPQVVITVTGPQLQAFVQRLGVKADVSPDSRGDPKVKGRM